ncbi:MAG TPA: hydroxyethylthiazole kinase [Xanthobacteraceae bacterium]|nr:hydroxyethylthiazole kinase [Xanthobacteraceae bacterium]
MLSPDRPISSKEIPSAAADVLARIRAQAPRVHCITNAVAQNFSANMLLAAGAIPSMTISVEEVGEFAGRADALLVNLGTFDAERRTAAELAIAAVRQAGKPWLLDPVFVERSPQRAAFARTLLTRQPAVVRLNRAEFAALSGGDVDGAALARFAQETHTVIGLTGEADIVLGDDRLACISNGDPLMAKVTAMGCAGSALVGACLAVEKDAFLATAAGLLILGVAGQIAAARAGGPGTFAAGILDAVHALDRATIVDRARVV